MFKRFIFFVAALHGITAFGQDLFEPIIPREYVCVKTSETMKIDGLADEACWSRAVWTDLFQDIEGDAKPKPYYDTRAKIVWDDDFIYFFAEMEEEHVWADIEKRDQVIFYNNDFEIFLKPYTNATHYCELEVNALGTAWDLLLMNAYRAGGPIVNDWNMDELQIGVNVDGKLNHWKKKDKGWSVEIAVPWSSLDELLYGKKHKQIPDPWRLNFSRVQWEHDIVNKQYQRKKFTDEHNWVWCQQSAIDMHRPEHWGYLLFTDGTKEDLYQWRDLEAARQYLFYIYREQKHYRKQQYINKVANPSYASSLEALELQQWFVDGEELIPQLTNTHFGFEVSLVWKGVELTINESGELMEEEIEPFVFAAWVHGNKKKSDEEWLADFRRAKEAGITDLFIGGGADELRRYVELTKDMGLNIHGWVWTLNRPGDSIARQHPEWYAVNRKGQNSLEYNAYVGYYQWLSPFSEGAREHIKNNIRAIAEVEGLKSVHLDYVRYCDVILGKALQPKYNLKQTTEMPEYDYGYHPIAIEAYKAQTGFNPMEMEHPELSTEWRQFRLNAVTSLVNELADIAHAHDKDISAAVFPFPEMSRSMVRQDWSSWNLDIALPMIYHNFYEENLNWIQFATEQGVNELDGRFPLYSGLYLPALSPAELGEAIEKARAGGAKGVCFFELKGLSEEHLEVIRANVRD